LWEVAKANLEKVHKWYKDFIDKSWRELKFQEGEVVEHQEFLIARRFESQVLGPICGSIQSVGK
jgi:hypothetical protein